MSRSPAWIRVRDSLHARAQRLLGIPELQDRVERLEGRLLALEPDGWDRSRERWRAARPDTDLTWGRELSGDAFLEQVSGFGGFGPDARILEIGPGYGRLLKACLDRGVPFAEYLGLDISATNVEHLRRRFSDPRVSFVEGDAEQAVLEQRYDLLISSLVLKHLYPTFERALSNCAGQLEPGALVCFDLIEGGDSFFEQDQITYIRWYTRTEVQEILERCGLELVAFGAVTHDPTHERLLTVARKGRG
jgi:SAM-dependent methyltransferase